MIAVAIVGILTAIAYPSYKSYVVRSNRADAQQALMQAAQQAERYFTQNNSYDGLSRDTAFSGESTVKASRVYGFFVRSTDTSFELRALPTTDKANNGDGVLVIDHTGRKSWDRNNDNTIADSERNWNR